MATNHLLQSLSDDPQLEKQIGCMAGILQLFDRHQVLTGRKFYGHKRIAAGNKSGAPTDGKRSSAGNTGEHHHHPPVQPRLCPPIDVNELQPAEDVAKASDALSAESSLNAASNKSSDVASISNCSSTNSSSFCSCGSDTSSSAAHGGLPPRLKFSRSLHEPPRLHYAAPSINSLDGNKTFPRRSVDTAERAAAAAAAAAREALRGLSRMPDYPTPHDEDSRPPNIRDIVRASFSQQQQDVAPQPILNHSCRGHRQANATSRRDGGAEPRKCSYATQSGGFKDDGDDAQVRRGSVGAKLDGSTLPAPDHNESLRLLTKSRGSPGGGPYNNNPALVAGGTRFSFHNYNPSCQPDEPARASCIVVDSLLANPRFSLDVSCSEGRASCTCEAEAVSSKPLPLRTTSWVDSRTTVSCSNTDCEYLPERSSFGSNVVAKLMGLKENISSSSLMHPPPPPAPEGCLAAPVTDPAATREISNRTVSVHQMPPVRASSNSPGKCVSGSILPSTRREQVKLPAVVMMDLEDDGGDDEYISLPLETLDPSHLGAKLMMGGRTMLEARYQSVSNWMSQRPFYRPRNHHFLEDRPPPPSAAKLRMQIQEMQEDSSRWLQREANRAGDNALRSSTQVAAYALQQDAADFRHRQYSPGRQQLLVKVMQPQQHPETGRRRSYQYSSRSECSATKQRQSDSYSSSQWKKRSGKSSVHEVQIHDERRSRSRNNSSTPKKEAISRHSSPECNPSPETRRKPAVASCSSARRSVSYSISPSRLSTADSPRTPERCGSTPSSRGRRTGGGGSGIEKEGNGKQRPGKKEGEADEKRRGEEGPSTRGGRGQSPAERRGKEKEVKRRLHFAVGGGGGGTACVLDKEAKVAVRPRMKKKCSISCTSISALRAEEEQIGSSAAKGNDDDTESQGDKSTGSSCEQPSPVSVLEGPFHPEEEDDDDEVDLEEDEDDGEEEAESIPSTTPPKPAAPFAPGMESGVGDNHESSLRPEHTEGDREDVDYVTRLLHALLQPEQDDRLTLAPLDPRLFALLEKQQKEEDGVESWRRKLLFDAVDESLRRKAGQWRHLQQQPWALATKDSIASLDGYVVEGLDGENNVILSREGSRRVVKEVWEEVCGRRRGVLSGEEEEDIVGGLLEAEVMIRRGDEGEVVVLGRVIAELALEMERLIFKDLVHHILRDLAAAAAVR